MHYYAVTQLIELRRRGLPLAEIIIAPSRGRFKGFRAAVGAPKARSRCSRSMGICHKALGRGDGAAFAVGRCHSAVGRLCVTKVVGSQRSSYTLRPMALSDVLNAVGEPVKYLGAIVVGGFGRYFWERYDKRLAPVRWSVSYNHVAIARADPAFGNIEVRWNGNPVTNLQFCNIEIENESNKDFQDPEVKFWFQDGTRIHGQGTLQNTAQEFPYTASFQRRLDAVFAAAAAVAAPVPAGALPSAPPDPAEINLLLGRREYRIPVLNRGTRFALTFLVHPGGAGQPNLEVYCDHPGVRLLHRAQRPMYRGVVQEQAAWIGLVAAIFLSFGVAQLTDKTAVVATAAFLLAAFAADIGAGLIHLKRGISRAIA